MDFLKRSKVASRDSLMSRMWVVFDHPVRDFFGEEKMVFEQLGDGFGGYIYICMYIYVYIYVIYIYVHLYMI